VGGYIDAKISGLRQLKQVLTDSVPRPIHAGEEKVAVVSATCQDCHQPHLMSTSELDTTLRYGYDLANTERQLRLLFHRSHEPTVGTHWHAGLQITYRAADERKQRIPWLKVRRRDGSEAVYEDPSWAASSVGAPLGEERTFVCIDCHSRPAHRFEPPDVTVDRAIAYGEINRSLPSIKKVAVAALSRSYDGGSGVEEFIHEYYRTRFGGRVLERRESLGRAIETIARIHATNIFPEMQVNWTTHPDNLGHRGFPGCFRCHGGEHRNAGGETLVADCAACHEFLEKSRDSQTLTAIAADGSAFHPFRHEDHEVHECWSCHTQTASPYDACGSCHAEEKGIHDAQFECSICHEPGRVEVDAGKCGPCHSVRESPMHVQSGHAECLSCHAPHTGSVAAGSCAAAECHAGADAAYEAAHRAAFLGVGFQVQGLPVTRTPK
jgi:hypothetical protein